MNKYDQDQKTVASQRELDAALIVFACIVGGIVITFAAIAAELIK